MRASRQIAVASAGALMLSLGGAVTPRAAIAEDLTVTVFVGPLGETLKTAILNPYKESGVNLGIDERDWGIGAVRTKIQSGSNVWDVVTVEDVEARQGCDEGFFAKIDKSKLPNLKDFDLLDGRSECGIPYVFYKTALGYDKNRTKDEPKSWADFWDVKKYPGKRSMYRTPIDALEIALLADGVERAKIYQTLSTTEGVDRAFRKLDQIKPYIIWWTNVGQSRQMLASGETVMSSTYDNGLYYFNKTQKTNFGVVLNGAITHVDSWAIIEGTPHLDQVYKYLDYATRPDVQARVTNLLAISVPNRRAASMVDKDLKPFISTDPKGLELSLESSGEFWLNNYDALSKRFEAWVGQ
jgi:putative spermidine/putrescine transport system substrate-binding protein